MIMKLVQWFAKQTFYVKIFTWLKERTEGLLFTIVLIFLVSYFHSEYLDYIEFKTKAPDSNIGLSFVIKNVLILFIALGYGYFYFVIKKTKQSIVKKEQVSTNENQNEMVNSLDEFLNEDELKK